MMPASGTFRYVATVPPEDQRESPWSVELAEEIRYTGDHLGDSRLVGYNPTLAVTAFATELPSGRKPMKIPLARLTLRASGEKNASVSTASFWVDKRMLSVFQAGDKFYLSRTACTGMGLSLLREDRLVFAAGAITNVPLGKGVCASTPAGLIAEAARPFQRVDREFSFREYPLLLEIEGISRIKFTGREAIGGYEVSVTHGFCPGMPGTDESAAITRSTVCKHAFAALTAEALDSAELEIPK